MIVDRRKMGRRGSTTRRGRRRFSGDVQLEILGSASFLPLSNIKERRMAKNYPKSSWERNRRKILRCSIGVR